MAIDLNAFCFVVAMALIMVLYLKTSVKCSPATSFLLDLKWRDQLSLAQIQDESADYWVRIMQQSNNMQQKNFCFTQVHEAIKDASKMKKQEELAEVLASNDKSATLPDNVIKIVF